MWPNPLETADLVKFTEEVPNGKLHFLSSDFSIKQLTLDRYIQSIQLFEKQFEKTTL